MTTEIFRTMYGEFTVHVSTSVFKMNESIPKYHTPDKLLELPPISYFCTEENPRVFLVEMGENERVMNFYSSDIIEMPNLEFIEKILQYYFSESNVTPPQKMIVDLKNKVVLFDITNKTEVKWFTSVPWFVPAFGKETLCIYEDEEQNLHPYRISEDNDRLLSLLAFRNWTAKLLEHRGVSTESANLVYRLFCELLGMIPTVVKKTTDLLPYFCEPVLNSDYRVRGLNNIKELNVFDDRPREKGPKQGNAITLSNLLDGKVIFDNAIFFPLVVDLPLDFGEYQLVNAFYNHKQGMIIIQLKEKLEEQEKAALIEGISSQLGLMEDNDFAVAVYGRLKTTE